MSRSRPGAGLQALVAAVADERAAATARAVRAARVSAEPGAPRLGPPLPRGRATDRSGRLAPGTTPGTAPPPAPRDAPSADDAPLSTGPLDTGPLDTGPLDTGPLDTGPLDTGPLDARPGDTPPGTAAPVLVTAGDGGSDEDGRPDGPAEGGVPEAMADALELVRRSQAGDAEAFGELYDRYVDMVYRYLAYRVGSPQVAEDLTSETFLRALRSIGGWQWRGRDVGAWFVTIARNLVADHYKSSRYRLEVTTEDVTDLPSVPVTDGPEAAVLAGLDAEAVLAAVRRLRPEQQECVSLRFLQGMSVAETAEIMGRGEGAVKALQHRAVRALARLLPPAGTS